VGRVDQANAPPDEEVAQIQNHWKNFLVPIGLPNVAGALFGFNGQPVFGKDSLGEITHRWQWKVVNQGIFGFLIASSAKLWLARWSLSPGT
jgi:hypothetical protein